MNLHDGGSTFIRNSGLHKIRLHYDPEHYNLNREGCGYSNKIYARNRTVICLNKRMYLVTNSTGMNL
jgi:hypothetical protein